MVSDKNHCSYIKIFLFSLLLAVGFAGCVEKKVNTTSDSDSSGDNSSSNNSGDTGGNWTDPGSGSDSGDSHSNCKTSSPPGEQDGSQVTDYYKVGVLPKIVAHGTGRQNRHGEDYGCPPDENQDQCVWNSEEDLPSSYPPNIFVTDSRFNLRVKAMEGVETGSDAKGNECHTYYKDYTKLNIGVEVRAPNASSGDYYQFNEVPVGEFSKVHEFAVPPNASGPLVVEIKDLEWDGSCRYYLQQVNQDGDHYDEDDPGVSDVCPMAPIWDTTCVSLKFEFATDVTKDIPCPRTN